MPWWEKGALNAGTLVAPDTQEPGPPHPWRPEEGGGCGGILCVSKGLVQLLVVFCIHLMLADKNLAKANAKFHYAENFFSISMALE